MKEHLPLRGIRVHLAGSVPESATTEEAAGIVSFVQKFAGALLREGGTLIHGSHPTLVAPLRAAAQPFVQADGARDALVLVRTHQFATTNEHLEEIAEQREYSAVQIIPSALGNQAASLVPMRQWMAERSDVVVALGGKWYDVNKARAGVPDELEESLRRGKPGFAIAGFGGAIRGLFRDDNTLTSRLRNGLCEATNRAMAECTNVDQLVHTVISQIQLLPLSRETVSGSGRLFRILALDGGGLRGAFTAAVLAKWDAMLDGGGGKDFVKHFDMVAGTSTGAILAIGLSLGLAPKEMLDFYRTHGPVIFPKDRRLRHWLKSKHDSRKLREALRSVFGDRILSKDSCCRLVIPTVRATHGETEVIVTPHGLDRTAFRDISAVDAAVASSAAPTYFDEAIIDDDIAIQTYLDGGIWANNPVLPSIAEAIRYLGVPLEHIDVLSVGTMGNEADFTAFLRKGKAGWAPTIADLFFAAQEHAAATTADALLSQARHLRINQQTPTEIKLDDAEALEDLAQRGANVGKDSFIPVRSRFLDGFYAADWRMQP
ncbi:Putative sporulation hydrolase CotR [Planctomycetes bacterium Poly30]|uniref:Sporulation hydrolase CotR n=1 Tax=Saltatorellus ferox TaxID=2528018 RepID=A0A518EZ17_9BACT|nr:Putative sporulation hydrolase CotR [Planctomycetes bacterium Poly30]